MAIVRMGFSGETLGFSYMAASATSTSPPARTG